MSERELIKRPQSFIPLPRQSAGAHLHAIYMEARGDHRDASVPGVHHP